MKAKAATTEPGSLVEQSKEVRKEVEDGLKEKLMEFVDKKDQVEADLAEKKAEVEGLSLADLNKDVCGRATEECDDTCGGAGCEQGCGGIGCNGAVTYADVAQERAKKTQNKLEKLATDAIDLQSKIQVKRINIIPMVLLIGLKDKEEINVPFLLWFEPIFKNYFASNQTKWISNLYPFQLFELYSLKI